MQMMGFIIFELFLFYVPFTLSLILQFLLIKVYQFRVTVFVPNIIASFAYLFIWLNLFLRDDIYLPTTVFLLTYNIIYVLFHKKSRALRFLAFQLFLHGAWVGFLSMMSKPGPSSLMDAMIILVLFCLVFGFFLLLSAQKTKEIEELESEILNQNKQED